MKRKEFLKLAGGAAMIGGMGWTLPVVGAENEKVPPRNPRPYTGLDWSSLQQIHTTSHGHCTDQNFLDAYLNRGLEFLTLSNYYPSAPWWPMKTMTQNYYQIHHDFPVMVNGKRTNGPFNWNEIVKPWAGEIEEEYKKHYPFKEGGLVFKNVPDHILEAPNAEHHGFISPFGSFHMCAPGSAFRSGTFDARNRFRTKSHGYHFGSGEPWRIAIDRMIRGLIFPDGGGVTINHPSWSRLGKDFVVEVLDHDPRVLGCEVFNQSCKPSQNYPWSTQFTEDYWDYALSKGRQCFGFFVPDWARTEGVNVLLVPERTVHECLKAYRQGNWYGAIKGRGILRFTHISFDSGKLLVKTDKPARFQVISKQGVVKEETGTELAFQVGEDVAKHGYLRAKAYATDNSGEILFTQPMMLTANAAG